MSSGPTAEKVLGILNKYVGPTMARPIFQLSAARSRANMKKLTRDDAARLLRELELGLRYYLKDPARQTECLGKLRDLLSGQGDASITRGDTRRTEVIPVHVESDIVTARGTGRDLCKDLGFPTVVQIKVATAISELARNIVQYAGSGEVTIALLDGPNTGIEVVATDSGPGIHGIDRIMAGQYRSKTGMGMGLMGCKNLVDEFDVRTAPGAGTTVTLRKYLR